MEVTGTISLKKDVPDSLLEEIHEQQKSYMRLIDSLNKETKNRIANCGASLIFLKSGD